MKYAKKFKVVPYSAETPGISQVNSTFNNALTSNTFPDEKVKIYNQALSKIKDVNPANLAEIEKNNNYEVINEDPNEDPDDRKDRIAKEISELEKRSSELAASKTVKDYSNSGFLKTQKFKEKSKFDNEKFMKILETLSQDVKDAYNQLYNMETHLARLSILKNATNTRKRHELSLLKDHYASNLSSQNTSANNTRLSEIEEDDESSNSVINNSDINNSVVTQKPPKLPVPPTQSPVTQPPVTQLPVIQTPGRPTNFNKSYIKTPKNALQLSATPITNSDVKNTQPLQLFSSANKPNTTITFYSFVDDSNQILDKNEDETKFNLSDSPNVTADTST